MIPMLDRAYQLELLKRLAADYPAPMDMRESVSQFDEGQERRFCANMIYLEEHGLIKSSITRSPDGRYGIGTPRINMRGMDFLANDGGLSAILDTVTVKFHEDTLKQLLEIKISQSNLSPGDKNLWLAALKKLPAESTKHLALKLMDWGLAHAPDALQQLGKSLGFPL